MRKKNINQKLVLKKTTISDLNSSIMGKVYGGVEIRTTVNNTETATCSVNRPTETCNIVPLTQGQC